MLSVARNFKNRQESESESEDQPSEEVQRRIKTKYGYIPRRLNPKRKCKKGEL